MSLRKSALQITRRHNERTTIALLPAADTLRQLNIHPVPPSAMLYRCLPLLKHSTLGLFNLFKKPVAIQDDLFGSLRFMDFNDTSKNYFEGKGVLRPTNGETELLIHADKEGPTDEQKQFYLDLQADFDRYIQSMKPMIEDEFRNWKEDFVIKDFNKEFNLVCITIPRLDTNPLIWNMAFTTVHDLNHHVTVDFVNDQPDGILIDG